MTTLRLAFVAATLALSSAVQNCCNQVRIGTDRSTFPYPDASGIYSIGVNVSDGKPVYENSAGYFLFFQASDGNLPLNNWRIATTITPDDAKEALVISENNGNNVCPQQATQWQTKVDNSYQAPATHPVSSECETPQVCCTSVNIPAETNGGYFFLQGGLVSPDGIHAKHVFKSQDNTLMLTYNDVDGEAKNKWAVSSVNSGTVIYYANGLDTQCPDGADGWPGDFDVYCETPGPSISPTISPTTSLPTVSPTISPTTSNPTLSPTTSNPTISPTISPTTSNPTISPTISPTTSNPTVSPTVSPTISNPTISPTISPTTSNPSISPTLSPSTSNPTVSPSISPTTSNPTVSPTLSPSTSNPTMSPTISPTTSNPTISPTISPTLSPTVTTEPTHSPSVSPTTSPTNENCAFFCKDSYVPTGDGVVCGIASQVTYETACEACQAGTRTFFTAGKCTTVPPTASPTVSPSSSPSHSPTPFFCSQSDYAACYEGYDCTPIPPCDTQSLVQSLTANYPTTCGDLADALGDLVLGAESIPTQVSCACVESITNPAHIDMLKCIPQTSENVDCPHSLFEDRAICNAIDHRAQPQWKNRKLCESDVVLSFGMATFGNCLVAATTATKLHPHITALHADSNGLDVKYFSYSEFTKTCYIHSPEMTTCGAWSTEARDDQGFFEVVDGTAIGIWEEDASNVAQEVTFSTSADSVRCNYNEISKDWFVNLNAGEMLKLCNVISGSTEICMERNSAQECVRTATIQAGELNAQPGGDGRLYLPQDIVNVATSANKTEAAEVIMNRKVVDVFEPNDECRGGSVYCEHVEGN